MEINTTTKPKPQQSKPSQAALKYGTSAFGFYGETTALTSSCQKPRREKRRKAVQIRVSGKRVLLLSVYQ